MFKRKNFFWFEIRFFHVSERSKLPFWIQTLREFSFYITLNERRREKSPYNLGCNLPSLPDRFKFAPTSLIKLLSHATYRLSTWHLIWFCLFLSINPISYKIKIDYESWFVQNLNEKKNLSIYNHYAFHTKNTATLEIYELFMNSWIILS